jgi:hypothetical protein
MAGLPEVVRTVQPAIVPASIPGAPTHAREPEISAVRPTEPHNFSPFPKNPSETRSLRAAFSSR